MAKFGWSFKWRMADGCEREGIWTSTVGWRRAVVLVGASWHTAAQSEAHSWLFKAADGGQPTLLEALACHSPLQVVCSLAAAASQSPQQLRHLLLKQIEAPSAFALGQMMQKAAESECSACASRVARQATAIFSVFEGEDAQAAARHHLLSLSTKFVEAAAASVMQNVLGLRCCGAQPPADAGILPSLLVT